MRVIPVIWKKPLPSAVRCIVTYRDLKVFVERSRPYLGGLQKPRFLMLSDLEMPAYRQHYQTPAERFNFLPPGIEKRPDRAARPSVGAPSISC